MKFPHEWLSSWKSSRVWRLCNGDGKLASAGLFSSTWIASCANFVEVRRGTARLRTTSPGCEHDRSVANMKKTAWLWTGQVHTLKWFQLKVVWQGPSAKKHDFGFCLISLKRQGYWRGRFAGVKIGYFTTFSCKKKIKKCQIFQIFSSLKMRQSQDVLDNISRS